MSIPSVNIGTAQAYTPVTGTQQKSAPAPSTSTVATPTEVGTGVTISSGAAHANAAEAATALQAGMKAPTLEERIAMADRSSNEAWDKVSDQKTWRAAGMSPEDCKAISERAKKQALDMVGGDPKSPGLGEAQYICQADQIANWATGKVDSAGEQIGKSGDDAKTFLGQADALKTLVDSGTKYEQTRLEYLQLSHEQAMQH